VCTDERETECIVSIDGVRSAQGVLLSGSLGAECLWLGVGVHSVYC
jgi:hypothetical protein